MNIQQKMARGAAWMLLYTWSDRCLGFISTLILVRILSPSDFGVVEMAVSFIIMAELLTRFGFDVALIQRQDSDEEDYHTAWTCNVLLGLSIATLMVVAAGPISRFEHRPELFWIVCTLALGPLVSGFENVGAVAFRKSMDFRREFRFQISRKIVGFLVVIPLALITHSYWALIAGTLSARAAGTVTSYLVHPFRPRFSLARVRRLMGFSKWLLSTNMVNFFKERTSDFVIGRSLGASSLGVYNLSYEIASMPTSELSAPINRALLPGFSAISKDRKAVRRAYSTAMGSLALIAVPAAAGIFAVAPYLVPVVLGTKWLAAVPLMQILAINAGLLLFHSSICTVVIASGNPGQITKTNGAYVVFLVALQLLLTPIYGALGVASAALGASILATPVYLYQVRKAIGIPPIDFLRAATRPAIAAGIMTVLLREFMPTWTATMRTSLAVSWLVGAVALGAVAYIIAVFSMWRLSGSPAGLESLAIEKAKQWLAGHREAQPDPAAAD